MIEFACPYCEGTHERPDNGQKWWGEGQAHRKATGQLLAFTGYGWLVPEELPGFPKGYRAIELKAGEVLPVAGFRWVHGHGYRFWEPTAQGYETLSQTELYAIPE